MWRTCGGRSNILTEVALTGVRRALWRTNRGRYDGLMEGDRFTPSPTTIGSMVNAFMGGVKNWSFFQTFDARALGLENLSFWQYVPKISLAVRRYKNFIFTTIGRVLKQSLKDTPLTPPSIPVQFREHGIPPLNSNSMAGLKIGKQTTLSGILCSWNSSKYARYQGELLTL